MIDWVWWVRLFQKAVAVFLVLQAFIVLGQLGKGGYFCAGLIPATILCLLARIFWRWSKKTEDDPYQ